MPYQDVLLHLDTYPDIAPAEGIDQAVAFCAALGASLTAVAFKVRIPIGANALADRLLGLGDLARDEEARSRGNVEAVLERFSAQAGVLGVDHQTLSPEADYDDRVDDLTVLARTRDLCVIPYHGAVAGQTSLAESVVFGSGRPVVILRTGPDQTPPRAIRRILIAWDGGRAASRAVQDAMPLLKAADEVRILTVLDDKASTTGGQAWDLARHLQAHGIKAEPEEYTAAGLSIGQVLEQATLDRGFDLLVMGAFGHTRLREFLLGGATQRIMTVPPIPVLLSH
jgi:nucleotide-binding universal stress UspA family protein